MKIHAAVVRSFDHPPRFESFELPDPTKPTHVRVEVLAVGLHPRVRSGANGTHYTSTGVLPMVPGVDGVGRTENGQLMYFAANDELLGPMATHAVIDTRRSIELPADTDINRVAAAMNPAMSSWVALRQRVPIEAGQSVLILGATGNAGQIAIQVAKHLGAGRVIGAGRDLERIANLRALGINATVALTTDPVATATALADAAGEVDIVIDYLWGEPATQTMMALLRSRRDRSRLLNWIQIGSVAGPTIELPSVVLRSANFRLQGNGQGAVTTTGYLAELPSLVDAINNNVFTVNVRPVPLNDVEKAWTAPETLATRTVVVP
jgi:NADPH:quinone reductase-like Zn-dependent oxidoreductase